MDAKCTPGPWKVHSENPNIVNMQAPAKRGGGYMYAACGGSDILGNAANAARIVACVNGCEGLNPAAYREVLDALEGILDILPDSIMGDHSTAYYAARTAIANAKGN
jgi:hypothetical protein